jgi:hypothetical protein
MLGLTLGIVVFLGVHSLTTFRERRTNLIETVRIGVIQKHLFAGGPGAEIAHWLLLIAKTTGTRHTPASFMAS